MNAQHPLYLILLGPPGSGKGTQAHQLSKELNIPHISTGDLFRDNIKNQTELGKKAKSFMDQGKLVPDEIVLDMLFDRIAGADCIDGFLLDGFPRTVPQAETFENLRPKNGNLVIINLMVPDEVILKRTAGRLTCKQCGHVHNKYFLPPKEEGVCDKCGCQLWQRPDDQAEIVQERLKNYHAHTKPLIAHYTAQGQLSNINGDAASQEVHAQLINIIKTHIHL